MVIGNCQGGWAVMMLGASQPELTGALVLNGAPLSYWAGERGRNPMRYLGGLAGGSWPAALMADLGNGKFDGAGLVLNFEACRRPTPGSRNTTTCSRRPTPRPSASSSSSAGGAATS